MSKAAKGTLLGVLFVLYYLLPLAFRDLWQPDETRYAEISREMLQSGNWIVPHFFDLRYFEKPIAGYWINNISQWIFGHNNFAVRFGSVFCASVSALLIYWLARRLWQDRATALLGAVIFLTSLLVYAISTYAVLDPMLLLWLTAAMCCYWGATEARSRAGRLGGFVLFGFACGMGFMTKGFLALAVPVLAIVPWALMSGRMKQLICYGPLAILSAAAISAPWALAINQQEPDFWHYFFWVEHIQRFAEKDAQHKAPFWYYLPVLIGGTLPWLAFLPGALKQAWQQRQEQRGGLYLLSWVVMPLLFFSVAKGKLPTYILPCFAPLALLLAHYARHLTGTAVLRWNGWINLLFGALTAAVVLVVLAPWGVTHRPVYHENEVWRVVLAAAAFLGWALVGYFTLRQPEKHWKLAALCPLVLALVVGSAIPEKVRDSKQPQEFVAATASHLAGSRYILVNNPGVGSAVAWHLQRSDIMFWSQKGEIEYGLGYADANGRFVSTQEFPGWLATHRKLGKVALVLLLPSDKDLADSLPKADYHYRQGRFDYLQYDQTP
ncbi:lipid IV(A) 4-amino-4-deoxy-L-arabinosyltransferase [Pantoea sp. A4]|uniref:lipid IV(A) 4-amino-4-deoxy-L-arabinosyltransferase n=1 Tax=Pantoea sp. A4 TaxID=1225184 RepID=UPI0003613128|nr:lipid IV(A) 4-amino-4-deoxy-L-arabinosyltransferase [Pantoea sp. A4]